MDLFTLRTYFLDVRHPFVQVASVEGSEASDIGIGAIVRLVLQPSYRWSRFPERGLCGKLGLSAGSGRWSGRWWEASTNVCLQSLRPVLGAKYRLTNNDRGNMPD